MWNSTLYLTSQLPKITYLAGKTPDMEFQFATFNGSNYDGNPLLFEPMLKKNLTTTATNQEKDEEEDYNDKITDMQHYQLICSLVDHIADISCQK